MHIQNASKVYLMLEEDLFVLYMRLSMVINVELLAVLECENQTLRLVALMLLSGRRMSIRRVNQHLLAYST